MLEFIIIYFFVAFVVFCITRNKPVSFIWPVITIKFIFGLLQKRQKKGVNNE